MAKQVVFNEEARSKIKKGIDIIARAVGVTIGPFGRNVALAKSYGGPSINNDGVTIARDISLKDPFENLGAEIVKEIASKTNDVAGDGTSTSVILAHAMVDEGLKQVDKGVNALSVRRGMEQAHKVAEKELDKMTRSVSRDDEVAHVASVSAESTEYGKIIAETVQKVGHKGVVTVEESQSFGIDSSVVEGLQIDKGYVSPYMVTNPERMEAEYKDVPVLVTDKKISGIKEVLPFLEKLAQSGKKDLVIVADDVEGEALTTFVLNKLRGTFNVLGVKAPGYGDRKKDMLGDIAVTIGAQVVSSDLGMSFDTIALDVLGHASKVVARKDNTIIIGNEGVKDAVQSRVAMIEKQLEETESKFDREKLEERIAKLSGGVAVIKVGAATEAEMKYLKLKIEDAVNATKAAIEEGVVPGGGSALAHVAKILRETRDSMTFTDAFERKGYDIVVQALEAPLARIAENALGDQEGKAIVREVQGNTNVSVANTSGYDALSGKTEPDMFAVGIIDPVKVTKSGLRNAVSTVGIFLTTEAAVVDIPEKESAHDHGHHHGGGMDGMY